MSSVNDLAPPNEKRRRWLLPMTLLIACAVLLALLATPMFVGHVYVGDDLGAFHLPLRAFYAQQLQAGESFDWWPQLFAGFYVTGEGQLGGYHPLHLALYKYLPLTVAFNLEVFLSYPIMLLGMFLWLRRLLPQGGTAMLRREGRFHAPALFGAVVFTFSGFNLLHLFHVNGIAVVAHVPWLLLAIDVLLRTANRRAAAWAWLALAMLTGSQLLLGYPQYVWFSLLAEAGYAMFVLATSDKRQPFARSGWRCCTPLASAKAVGLLLGGLQLIPTYDALQHSVRHSVEAGFAESYSLHPLNLVQLIAPYLFENRVVGQNTHAMGLYAGAVPLMLMVYLFTERRRLGRLKPVAVAAACLGIFALLMALGRYGFLYRVQTWLPVVGNFRAPCRMIVLFHLSTAVLSAVGLVHLARRRSATTTAPLEGRWRPYGMTVAVSVALLPLALVMWTDHLASLPRMLAGPVLLAIAAALVLLASRRVSWALSVLVLFCAADLGVYGMSYSVWQRTEPYSQFVAEVDVPEMSEGVEQGSTRVARSVPAADSTLRVGNALTLAGYDRIHGYAGLEPARWLDYRDPRVLQLAGVRLAHRDVFGKGQEEQPAAREQGNNYGLAPFEPLPRFRLVTEVWTSQNPMADLNRLDEASALVERPLKEALTVPTGQGVQPGVVHAVADQPGHIRLMTDAPSKQLLVVSEAYHPGWQVFVDGVNVPTQRVNGDFLGSVVPAGEHSVVLIFSPESLAAGRGASSCGLGLLCVGFVLLRFRRRTTSSAPDSLK